MNTDKSKFMVKDILIQNNILNQIALPIILQKLFI